MLNIVTEKQEQAIKDKVSEVLLLMTPNKILFLTSDLSFSLNDNNHYVISLK